MQHHQFSKMLAGMALISTIAASCSHDHAIDDNTASHFIQQSESLTLPAAIDVPANLPNGNQRVATFFATGVQKYKAQQIAGSNPVAYQWVFVAPEANLYDATNQKVGTHSAGPTWQLSATDSIFGQQFTPARFAASPDANSIDWLLLMPKTGKAPTGVFAQVSYIQRIATNGGKAPTVAPVNPDQTVDVPYTAVYRFTKRNE